MTERDYCLYIIGHNDKALEEAKAERFRLWMLYKSFGDPKLMPKTMQQWMPLKGDNVKSTSSVEQIIAADNAFKNFKKKL